jgi:hypothetical protein
VLREPLGEVQAGFLLFDRDGVAGEEVRDDDEVAVGGEGVGEAGGMLGNLDGRRGLCGGLLQFVF